ncbi:hypothetical protein CTA1_7571 [Colletotrichum tanaceti]|uniref:Uncharacterized protein n=1 Tax=Colletotrichum tanaceti TaxID=1306861 RepID=A0A4U6XQT1_9PEZI|nr:hypothetical protein CTA1_7571 [Colletotrichum tanaceti]
MSDTAPYRCRTDACLRSPTTRDTRRFVRSASETEAETRRATRTTRWLTKFGEVVRGRSDGRDDDTSE